MADNSQSPAAGLAALSAALGPVAAANASTTAPLEAARSGGDPALYQAPAAPAVPAYQINPAGFAAAARSALGIPETPPSVQLEQAPPVPDYRGMLMEGQRAAGVLHEPPTDAEHLAARKL